jgi:hypothetical protein
MQPRNQCAERPAIEAGSASVPPAPSSFLDLKNCRQDAGATPTLAANSKWLSGSNLLVQGHGMPHPYN